MVDIGSLVKVVPEADAKLQSGPVETSRVMSADRRRDRHPDLPAGSRVGHQHDPGPASAGVAEQHHHRVPQQQFAGDHRLRGQRHPAGADHRQPGQSARRQRRPGGARQALDRDRHRRRGFTPAGRDLPRRQHAGRGGRCRPAGDGACPTPAPTPCCCAPAAPPRCGWPSRWSQQLDQPASGEQANMRVIYLRNAEAVKLVEVLRAVLSGDQTRGGGSGMSPSRNPNPQSSGMLGRRLRRPGRPGARAPGQPRPGWGIGHVAFSRCSHRRAAPRRGR